VTNPSVGDLWDVRAIVKGSPFRPLENLSFAVDHALWGWNPFGFHLTNLLLHAINVALFFSVTCAAVRDSRAACVDQTSTESAPSTTAVVAAGLFAVHPLLTEAVGYISARGDLLSATCSLLALLAARRGLLVQRWQHWLWMGLALILFGLALAAKEVGAMFPFVLLTYDRLLLRHVPEPARRLRWLHLPLGTVVILAGTARVAFFLCCQTSFEGSAVQRMGQYLLIQFEVLWRYVVLLLAPVSLSIFHDVGFGPRRSFLGATALLVAGVLVFLGRRRAPIIAFGGAWFLLLLVPSSSIIPLPYTMAEHRVYQASMGMFLIFASAFTTLRVKARRWAPWLRISLSGALVIIVAVLSALTVARNGVWSDSVTLWRDAAQKTPQWQTYFALGDALREQRRCGEAIPAYREAIARSPRRLLPYAKLSACLTDEGRLAEAQQVKHTLLTMDPGFVKLCREMQTLSAGRLRVDDCVAGLAK
jgi:protein O-mannosyl-transferase